MRRPLAGALLILAACLRLVDAAEAFIGEVTRAAWDYFESPAPIIPGLR